MSCSSSSLSSAVRIQRGPSRGQSAGATTARTKQVRTTYQRQVPEPEPATCLSAHAMEADLFARAERCWTGPSACLECSEWAHCELKRQTQRVTRRPGKTRGIIRPVSEPARVPPRPLPRVFPPGGAQKVPMCTTRSGHACADIPLRQRNGVS